MATKKKTKKVAVRPSRRGETAELSTVGPDRSGDLELRLDVNGHVGRLWISKEFWEAMGEKAGWTP